MKTTQITLNTEEINKVLYALQSAKYDSSSEDDVEEYDRLIDNITLQTLTK